MGFKKEKKKTTGTTCISQNRSSTDDCHSTDFHFFKTTKYGIEISANTLVESIAVDDQSLLLVYLFQ